MNVFVPSLIEDNYLLWLIPTIVSVTLFVGTLLAIPLICIRLPTDYFVRDATPKAPWRVVLRTALAVVLLAAGAAMLVLPGQGILTILIGISFLDFPAKRRWQRRILQRPTVLRALNGIRKKADKPPLET